MTTITHEEWQRYERALAVANDPSGMSDNPWEAVDGAIEGFNRGMTMDGRKITLGLVAQALGVDKVRTLSAKRDAENGLHIGGMCLQGGAGESNVWSAKCQNRRHEIFLRLSGFPSRESLDNALQRILGRPEYDHLFEVKP